MASRIKSITNSRLKIWLLLTGFIFLLGYILLVTIEGMNYVDAFYFLVVTISTVGFGDITPTRPITKITVTLVIITGISTLAFVSERLVDRIAKYNSNKYLALPELPLEYSGHIVIAGYTNIASNIALLFQGRFFRVVIVDSHEDKVVKARDNGFESYLATAEELQTLKSLNIEHASALYLFLEDENTNVITSIQARSLSNDLLIFASADHELSIDLGNLVGINRTYHYERIVASNIDVGLLNISAIILPNQTLSDRCQYIIIILGKELPYHDYFPNFYPIGFLDSTLTTYYSRVDKNVEKELELGNYLLIAVEKEEFIKSKQEKFPDRDIVLTYADSIYDRIVIGGYNEDARHIIDEVSPALKDEQEFQILTFDKSEYERANEDGFDAIFAFRSNIKQVLSKTCTSKTLVVNLFEKITDSLLVNTVMKELDVGSRIIQLAMSRVEVNVFRQTNVDRILIPDILMSRGMFLIFLSTKKMFNSLVWGGVHIFEHYVDNQDPLINKGIKELRKTGYEVLLHKKSSSNNQVEVRLNEANGKISKGDVLILKRTHQFLQSTRDQIIDSTHN